MIRRRHRKMTLHGAATVIILFFFVYFWFDLTDDSIRHGVFGIDDSEYLYHIEEAKGIIIDYEAPVIVSSQQKQDSKKIDASKPDFLYGPNQGPRVVEFYAPWCPHVRSIYIDAII
jgi:hypothetical protein